MSGSLEQTLAAAYAYLNRRERTTAQMRAYLAKRTGSDLELAEAALAELIEQKYLDDARYARCFAEDRRNLDSWGTERIYRKLLEVGIDAETARQAATPEDGDQELRTALALLRRRMRIVEPDPSARQRALGMLLRRGYPAAVAYQAVRELESESSAGAGQQAEHGAQLAAD